MALNKAMLLFWSAGLLIFILGIQYYWGDSTLDINVHDTYYVIPSSFIFIFLTGIMGFIGFLYWEVWQIRNIIAPRNGYGLYDNHYYLYFTTHTYSLDY